jgi:hypothetical protein
MSENLFRIHFDKQAIMVSLTALRTLSSVRKLFLSSCVVIHRFDRKPVTGHKIESMIDIKRLRGEFDIWDHQSIQCLTNFLTRSEVAEMVSKCMIARRRPELVFVSMKFQREQNGND